MTLLRLFVRLLFARHTHPVPEYAMTDPAPRTRRATDPAVNEALTALLDALKVDLHPQEQGAVRLEVSLTLWPWQSQHEGAVRVHEEWGGAPRVVHVLVPE